MSPTLLQVLRRHERDLRKFVAEVNRQFGRPDRAVYPRDYYRPADALQRGWKQLDW